MCSPMKNSKITECENKYGKQNRRIKVKRLLNNALTYHILKVILDQIVQLIIQWN